MLLGSCCATGWWHDGGGSHGPEKPLMVLCAAWPLGTWEKGTNLQHDAVPASVIKLNQRSVVFFFSLISLFPILYSMIAHNQQLHLHLSPCLLILTESVRPLWLLKSKFLPRSIHTKRYGHQSFAQFLTTATWKQYGGSHLCSVYKQKLSD